MTILAKMTSLSLNPKHLTVCEVTPPNNFDEFSRTRQRSERASSLALPNNSLLDLYDKEQEECHSIALLPSNINVVVRRHSSHCYPSVKDKPSEKNAARQSPDRKLDLNLKTVSHQLSSRSTSIQPVVQNSKAAPSPPPIPKRTFRGKLSWNVGRSDINHKQKNPDSNSMANVANHQKYETEQNYNYNFCPLSKAATEASSTVQMQNIYPSDNNALTISQQCIYNGISPNEQASDDDRMSLENSVFDESIPSSSGSLVPVGKSTTMSSTNDCTHTFNISPDAKSNGFVSTSSNDLCNLNSYNKRANRSSGDSNKSQTTTSDTGYMSGNGSDRNPSDFRGRVSSVDTQSSLDSYLTEKTIDSPLSKDSNDTSEYTNQRSIVKCNPDNGVGKIKQLPAVPIRKQLTTPPKLPPPINANKPNGRPLPPTPPTRLHYQTNGDAVTRNLGYQSSNDDGSTRTYNIRNKLGKNKPPPIVYPKLHQRQDSSLSSDSFSLASSPGYNNTKNLMETPLLQSSTNGKRNRIGFCHQDSNDSFSRPGTGSRCNNPNKIHFRQDSTLSSDSFSQTSSPSYNSKIFETPLIPPIKKLCNVPVKQKFENETIEEAVPTSPITKSVSTPASLQTIVRFQNGTSNMSLQHRIVNRRKSSNPYVTNGRLKFRLFQILLNAFALLAIAGGLAAYFNAYPTIKFVNKTIINTIRVEDTSEFGKNPAPGTCLPIIVKFCQGPLIPYNYTVFPNYIGHFGQLETQVDLDAYDALVDVRCYELVSLFLCTLFVPKCGSTGSTVPPCRTLCTETMRRCGFFFDVFGLSLPEYLNCNLFKDFDNSDECVGLHQVRDVMIASRNPVCNGFVCDQKRCIPNEYVCDGHSDCYDHQDETKCDRCGAGFFYCGEDRCISGKHMCDGVIDCPYAQDERNCLRLSEKNGDTGRGVLEVYHFITNKWSPACVKNWDRSVSPTAVCSMLGYNSVNATNVVTQKTHRPLSTSVNVSTDIWKMYSKKRSNLMKEFSSCTPEEDFPIAELTCTNFDCGKVRHEKRKPNRRIIGGSDANPGDWPFLAAILGGPEKIFYCAGVLIADQWVLTASHCIGNHTLMNLENWTIQLGITRRNSYDKATIDLKVKTVIPHPLYNTIVAHDNDIALFQLVTRVSFRDYLLPVCLPPPGLKALKPGELCTVIGWGKREEKNPKATYEPIVNEVQVPVINRQQCDDWLDNLTVSDGMICAGFEEGGKDACQGDSGGPLLCPYPGKKDKWFVGGIVSWGIMCAHPKLPGVYANVVKYVPWILEEMQKHSKLQKPSETRVSNRNSNKINGYGNREPAEVENNNSEKT